MGPGGVGVGDGGSGLGLGGVGDGGSGVGLGGVGLWRKHLAQHFFKHNLFSLLSAVNKIVKVIRTTHDQRELDRRSIMIQEQGIRHDIY